MAVRKTLYQQVVVPTVTHGIGIWGLRESEMHRLNYFRMKFLRPMVGVTRWNRVRNDEIQRKFGIE